MVDAFESNNEGPHAVIKSNGESAFADAIKWLALMEFSNSSDVL